MVQCSGWHESLGAELDSDIRRQNQLFMHSSKQAENGYLKGVNCGSLNITLALRPGVVGGVLTYHGLRATRQD